MATLPPNVLEHVAGIFNLFESAGLIPTIWSQAQQVHLPKEGPRRWVC